MEFGIKVRARRTQIDMSQEELADELGLSRVSVANIERGRQRVLLHQAVILSRLLGIPLDEFVSADAKDVENQLKALPKAVQKVLAPVMNKARRGTSK